MNEKMASYKPISPFDFGGFHDKIKWKMISSSGAVDAARNMRQSVKGDYLMYIVIPPVLKFHSIFVAVL